MKGEGDCSEQHFLPNIFEMPTSLRPTVKVSDSERASTYPIITTLCQVFFLKNLEKKVVFFLSKLCRLTSPPPPARAQTPVVMISVTESGNYWTILFTPLARSELTRAHTPTRLQIPFSFRQEIRDFGQSVQQFCVAPAKLRGQAWIRCSVPLSTRWRWQDFIARVKAEGSHRGVNTAAHTFI